MGKGGVFVLLLAGCQAVVEAAEEASEEITLGGGAAVPVGFAPVVGLFSGLVNSHNQTAFRAHAVPVRAVIDQIYSNAPSQNYDAPTFDQYALVHFEARGGTAHARALLVANCRGTCFPDYDVGQVLTVYYSPPNLTYAQLPSPASGISASSLYAILIFGFLGVICFGAAAVNMVTA